jgi:hypothetical protein
MFSSFLELYDSLRMYYYHGCSILCYILMDVVDDSTCVSL